MSSAGGQEFLFTQLARDSNWRALHLDVHLQGQQHGRSWCLSPPGHLEHHLQGWKA